MFHCWESPFVGDFAGDLSLQASTLSYDPPGNLITQSNTVTAALPQFLQLGPTYLGVASNALMSFSVPVTGAGAMAYQWLFNGVAVAGATNDSFLITSAIALNLGEYQLVVSNISGVATSAVINVSFFDPSGSGLPVAWELAYFGHPGIDPNADPDGDGVSNYNEYLDGTDPTNPQSVMPRLNIATVAGGTVSVTPLKAKYQLYDTVTITALPNPGISIHRLVRQHHQHHYDGNSGNEQHQDDYAHLRPSADPGARRSEPGMDDGRRSAMVWRNKHHLGRRERGAERAGVTGSADVVANDGCQQRPCATEFRMAGINLLRLQLTNSLYKWQCCQQPH